MPCRAVKEFLVGMGFDADSVSAVLMEEPDVDRALALLLSQADSVNQVAYSGVST